MPELIEPVCETGPDPDFWVLAVPSTSLREVCRHLPSGVCKVLIATKGLEGTTAARMSEVVHEERPRAEVCVLSGPNLALEVARGIPTASVAASQVAGLSEWFQARLSSRSFRVYTATDVVGVEIGGALKNVYALGAGMSDGLGFGDNTKGAFLARGLREMAALGEAVGANRQTFLGLSGVGDLFATAASPLSRNYRVGRLLGEGMTLDRALEQIGQVAEGVPTSEAALRLACSLGVPVPLIESIHKVVVGSARPLDVLAQLMNRPPGAEFD